MTDQPDLFADDAPRLCGTCGELYPSLARPGYFCALSFKDACATDPACEMYIETKE